MLWPELNEVLAQAEYPGAVASVVARPLACQLLV
jgi:hypothetical protein